MVAERLAPDFSPAAAIREKSSELLREQITEHFSLGKVLSTAREFRDLVADLPAKANQVLELVAENKVRIDVDAVDDNPFAIAYPKAKPVGD